MKIKTEYSTINEATITFSNISLDINIRKKKFLQKAQIEQRPILKSLKGYFPKGLNAILGSSGAGKTSLLNVITKRIDNNETASLQGEIQINKKEYNFKSFNSFAGYVMQDDYLLPHLTVKEYLQFAADMMLKISPEQKAAKVQEIIKLLQLNRCQDTLIGDKQSKGISGGERKRCSIGMELIGEPQILILDEPTSGLDSFTSFRLINLLKQLSIQDNRTIIFTIHQPSSDIWNLFDRIFLMVDGKFIYQGLGQEKILNYFNSIGFQCPKYSNPADYYMSVMNTSQIQSKKKEYMIEQYDQTLQKIVEEEMRQLIETNKKDENEIKQYPQNKIAVRGFQMVKTLVKRQIKTLSRNKVLIYGRLIQVIVMGLIESAIYWQLSRNKDEFQSPYRICVYLFLSSSGMFLQSLNPQVVNFSIERPVFLKEVGQNLYTTEGYLLSKILPETITCSLFPILKALITYWMVGLTNDANIFFFYIFTLIVQSNVGNAFGILSASIFNETKIAIAFAMTFVVPQLLFGGLFKNSNDLRGWIRWIQYITPTFYASNSLVVNEFENTDFVYDPIQFLHFTLDKWLCIILLVVLYVGFMIIAYIIIRSKQKKLQ